MTPGSLVTLTTIAGLALTPAAASAQEGPQSDPALELFLLDSQLGQSVVTTTKSAQRSGATPAVVTVVTREELQARGYLSLAEVLRTVPGFYDVYDLVTHNVGIRGINGGVRASGNVLKLMIDGHPVDYRPSTGNFFGEELVPIELVERIEIVRGPASALYGANAFLGVVNVITREGAAIDGVRLSATANTVRSNPGGGGAVAVGRSADGVDVAFGASHYRMYRSGLEVPSQSPILQSTRRRFADGERSRDDLDRPASLLGRLRVDEVAGGQLSLLGTLQRQDAVGEFQDFGPMAHATRISLVNQNVRAGWQRALGESATLDVSVHYFRAAPTGRERLSIGRDDTVLLRVGGAEGAGAASEVRLTPREGLTLVAGADLVQERHLLQTFDTLQLLDVTAEDGTVIRSRGTVVPGEARGARQVFLNLGAWGQAHWQASEAFSVLAGARVDGHNIYGVNPSARAGLVYSPDERTSLKLLYGSSFKAPSAEQLYTQPLRTLDVQGNDRLRAQTAHTLELAGGRALGTIGELSLNVFVMDVVGRVEFVRRGLFLQAQNLHDEWVTGGEVDLRIRPTRRLNLRLTSGVARTVARTGESTSTGLAQVDNALFPLWQVHLLADYALPWFGLRVGAEASAVGPRPSSQANALERGAPYSLPAYFVGAASLSTVRQIWGDRETHAALRISRLASPSPVEPGFGGVDVPSPGPTAWLTFTQQL